MDLMGLCRGIYHASFGIRTVALKMLRFGLPAACCVLLVVAGVVAVVTRHGSLPQDPNQVM